MPTVTQLADAYRVLKAQQTDLDRRIIGLPPHDIEGRDTLMADLEPVLTDLHNTVRQLSRVRAQDAAALRAKAAVIIDIGKDYDPEVLVALAVSLAYDVADVLGSSP